MAAGDSPDGMLADFPDLRLEDIQAAISFAATTAAEDVPALVHTGGYSSIAIRIELEENLPLWLASALTRISESEDGSKLGRVLGGGLRI